MAKLTGTGKNGTGFDIHKNANTLVHTAKDPEVNAFISDHGDSNRAKRIRSRWNQFPVHCRSYWYLRLQDL